MDNQKAIKIIKNCTMLACEYHIKNKCNKDYSQKDDDFEQAKKIAVSAIERLIPKKPTGIVKTKVELLKVGKCPNCGSIIGEDTLWCDDCGQAIDWSK